MTTTTPARAWRRRIVSGAVALTLTAASVAVPATGGAYAAGATASTDVVRTDTTTRTHYYDAGTTFDEQGRPVRRIRRVNVKELRWRNEATGEQMEQVVPSEDEMQLELKTY